MGRIACSQNSCVEALTSHMPASGGEAFKEMIVVKGGQVSPKTQ